VGRLNTARLDDIADVLEEVRSWTGIEDRGGGTFYLRRRPFVHFHVGHDSRRADLKRVEGWLQIDLPEPASSQVRRRFLALLREEYEERVFSTSSTKGTA
jgi:hypothetical protein